MYNYIENKWITKEGNILTIQDMTTQHIKNVITFLNYRSNFYDNFSWDNCGNDFDYIDNSHLVDMKIEELNNELKRRGD